MISADFRRNPQTDWGQFFSDLNRILEEATGLKEFNAGLAEEEKLRRLVRATIAMKAVHPKEMMKKMIGRIKALVAVDWKRASEEKLRRLKAKINSMLAERVKSLLVKEEEARRTNVWFAERERLSSERLRQQQQREQQWRPLIMVL